MYLSYEMQSSLKCREIPSVKKNALKMNVDFMNVLKINLWKGSKYFLIVLWSIMFKF